MTTRNPRRHPSTAASPRPLTTNRYLLWGPVVVYMAAIFYLSAQSSPPVPGAIPDYVLHAIEYCGLAIVVFRALAGGLPAALDAKRVGLTLLITMAYAISDEVHQLFVPWRTADVIDLIADAAGAVLGLMVYRAWLIIGSSRARI